MSGTEQITIHLTVKIGERAVEKTCYRKTHFTAIMRLQCVVGFMSPIAHFSGKNGTSRSVTSNIRLLLYTCKAVKDWRPEIPLMMLLEVSTAAVSSDGGQKSRVGELKAESDAKPKKIAQPIDIWLTSTTVP